MPPSELPPVINGFLHGDIIRDEILSNFPGMPDINVQKLQALIQKKLRRIVSGNPSLTGEEQLAIVLGELDGFTDAVPVQVNKLSAATIMQILRGVFPNRIYEPAAIKRISSELVHHPDFIGHKYIQVSWVIELAEKVSYTTEDVSPDDVVPDFVTLEEQVNALFENAMQEAAHQRPLGKIHVTAADVRRRLSMYHTFSVERSDIVSAILFLHDRQFSRGNHSVNGDARWKKRTEDKA